ncbi:Gfo/Idh/MocA family protein [Arthrobacter sp. NPDC056691]|uniref:Gfo/Idh/MocA family protein n=1 Tax=Arthrobacter sp. NPDC056691 TaxID=3345913 RepID=UPI003670BD9E
MAIRIGLVGYGLGGRVFHAPFIQASDKCELVGIVTRSPQRSLQAAEDCPGVQIHPSLKSLVRAGVDAVVVTTPPSTRRELVIEAIASGVHVVADKPFAPSSSGGEYLAEAACTAGVLLNVFQNRRFDSDIVTARSILQEGKLGSIQRLELRCDQDDPSTLDAGPAGGLLRDLGSHVIDQALHLLGPVRDVTAYLDWSHGPKGSTNTAFMVSMRHASGAHSHVSASKLNRLVSKELRLLGSEGSYVSNYSDVQYEAILAGRRPANDRPSWGFESERRWGTLRVRGEERRIPSWQGDYTTYYDEFAAAISTGAPGPVPAGEAIDVLRVMDAAQVSANEQRTVSI